MVNVMGGFAPSSSIRWKVQPASCSATKDNMKRKMVNLILEAGDYGFKKK